MLSDSLFELSEELWEVIKRYGYSDSHRKELSKVHEDLLMIVWHHDRMDKDRTPEKRAQALMEIRQRVNDRWDEIAEGERDIE